MKPSELFEKPGPKASMKNYKKNFWKKVIKTNKCWNWQGAKNNYGYGIFGVFGKLKLSHRFSYEINKGKIPKGLLVCHSCDNPKCVNPEHLWLGTNNDNSIDKVRKGRQFKQNGEKAPNAKLKLKDVETIRKLYSTKLFTFTELGEIYSMNKSTIRCLIRRLTWK